MTTPKGRRLLAVMFTDVVGYTALMQSDEEAARIVRRRHRQVLEAAVSAHGGDLLQYLGDGSLTTFPSVVDAVRAAIEIQRGLRQEPVVPLRIGIHQGDISYDTQGPYGDSMNVASRIESLGIAGSILISGKAHDEIKNQPDITTTPLGEFELKNVEDSLAVYAIVSDVLAVPTRDDVVSGIGSAPTNSLDAIVRLNTALAGRYRVGREVGEGGMATVYLADDIKHERKVALKVLKPELAAIVGAERFLAEIKTTANLQHPHILPLFDSGAADSLVFYVMPYVEGESLREKLDREKQLPVDEAVRIAADVAEALGYAHRHGVIHRDIKPANVLIHAGQPMISDLGIALAVGVIGGDRLTATGLTPGTPHYMSPEQATGDDAVGPATDTYALGCVLHEMLVGEPPYTGSTPQAILGKILTGEPESVTAQRKSVPLNVDAAISKALEKLPADRFIGAQDFARALTDPGFRYGASAGAGFVPGAGPWNRAAVGFAALAAGLSFALGWSLLRPDPPQPPAPLARFSSLFEEGQGPTGVVELTPDGSALLYVGPSASGQGQQLWMRRWADLDATPIRGTEGAATFALSPDGREVAHAAMSGELRVAALDGSQGRTLFKQVNSLWRWTSDGSVYFTEEGPPFVIGRVLATGGDGVAVESVTEVLEGELGHGRFIVLPGEKMGVFQVYHSRIVEDAEVWAIDLDTGETEFLTVGNTPGYASTGHLLFATPDGVLMAVPIDPGSAELTGPAVPVAEGLTISSLGYANYSVSESGTLIYLSGGGGEVARGLEAVWVTRSGDAAPVDAGWRFGLTLDFGLRLSPSGAQLAFTNRVEGNTDIWIKQLPDGPLERLTFDDDVETNPGWTSDGQFVTYVGGQVGGYDAWRRRADGRGAPELLLDDERSLSQLRWSSDGEWMVFRAGALEGPSGEHDIVGFRPGIDSVAIPLIATAQFSELDPALSPDGRWLAYTSDVTGRYEVYVSPFPNVDSTRVSVSTNGGLGPLWAHSGRELFFVDANQRLVAAEIETTSGFTVLRSETLFALTEYFVVRGADFYDIAPDDQRFLMARLSGGLGGPDDDSRFILVENWFEELRQRMGN